MTAIPFIDLDAQRRRLEEQIDLAISRVLEHGHFIMGPEVAELEARLADFSGTDHVISCASGTDALQLALMAGGIGAGQAVFVPSFSFAATAEAVAVLGAVPVFVDVLDDTFNMDSESLKAAIGQAKSDGMTLGAVIPVDLYGQPADYGAIAPIAAEARLLVIADGAQSFGGARDGGRVGTLAKMTTTSFFPAKPLGCYGDGGAIMTDDAELAVTLRSLRVHGKGTDKYDNVRIGLNSRLDTLQAAILLEKMSIFESELDARMAVANRYADLLAGVATPDLPAGVYSAWAQYTLRLEGRDDVQAHLREKGIPSAVYYAKPLHQQSAYKDYPVAPGGLPVTERLSGTVLSLPMHPYLEADTQDSICRAVLDGVTP